MAVKTQYHYMKKTFTLKFNLHKNYNKNYVYYLNIYNNHFFFLFQQLILTTTWGTLVWRYGCNQRINWACIYTAGREECPACNICAYKVHCTMDGLANYWRINRLETLRHVKKHISMKNSFKSGKGRAEIKEHNAVLLNFLSDEISSQ